MSTNKKELKLVLKAMTRIVEHVETLPDKGFGQSGQIECPGCGKQTLRWYRSRLNGHIVAACKNKCVAFMQ